MATPQSVLAKVHNQNSYEEGAAATEALDPGQGCVIEEDADGNKTVRSANADELTARVVREQRNPPRGLGGEGESPLAKSYDIDNHAETVGFNRFDQARVRVAYETDADGNDIIPDPSEPMGWNADGQLTTTAAESVANFKADLSDEFDGFDLALVEFY